MIGLNNEEKFFNKDFSIRIIAADNCDPQLCYKFTGCTNFLQFCQTYKNFHMLNVQRFAHSKVAKYVKEKLSEKFY